MLRLQWFISFVLSSAGNWAFKSRLLNIKILSKSSEETAKPKDVQGTHNIAMQEIGKSKTTYMTPLKDSDSLTTDIKDIKTDKTLDGDFKS